MSMFRRFHHSFSLLQNSLNIYSAICTYHIPEEKKKNICLKSHYIEDVHKMYKSSTYVLYNFISGIKFSLTPRDLQYLTSGTFSLHHSTASLKEVLLRTCTYTIQYTQEVIYTFPFSSTDLLILLPWV